MLVSIGVKGFCNAAWVGLQVHRRCPAHLLSRSNRGVERQWRLFHHRVADLCVAAPLLSRARPSFEGERGLTPDATTYHHSRWLGSGTRSTHDAQRSDIRACVAYGATSSGLDLCAGATCIETKIRDGIPSSFTRRNRLQGLVTSSPDTERQACHRTSGLRTFSSFCASRDVNQQWRPYFEEPQARQATAVAAEDGRREPLSQDQKRKRRKAPLQTESTAQSSGSGAGMQSEQPASRLRRTSDPLHEPAVFLPFASPVKTAYRQNRREEVNTQHPIVDHDSVSWNDARVVARDKFSPTPLIQDNSTAMSRSSASTIQTEQPSMVVKQKLETELQWLLERDPHPVSIRTIIFYLLKEHQMKPAVRHYEALILSNCHPSGSAQKVQSILEEMEAVGIDIGASVYFAVLNALAVHPSHDLFTEVLNAMERRWIPVTSIVNHLRILTFLRTNQVELAYALFREMRKKQQDLLPGQRTPIPRFIYVSFIRYFVEAQDYEALIRFIYKLHDWRATEMELPSSLWSWVLDHAARDGDFWVSTWIWQDWVERMLLRPSRSACTDMLRIAARDGLPWLAKSVREAIEHQAVVGVEIQKKPLARTHENNIRSDTRSRSQVNQKSPAPLDCVTEEEEGLIDQAHSVCDCRSGGKSSGLRSLVPYNSPELAQRRQTSRAQRKLYPLPRSGNLWPMFDDVLDLDMDVDMETNIDDHASRRPNLQTRSRPDLKFNPWSHLGPKSRPTI